VEPSIEPLVLSLMTQAEGGQRLPSQVDAVVAIPARNEADTLSSCLRALAAQQGAGRFAVLVVANNCHDGTARLARGMMPELPFYLIVEEIELPADHRSVGFARKTTLDRAADLLDGCRDALLLSTDADASPAADWIARCRAHIASGCDAVAGHAVLVPGNGILPPQIAERCRREARLARLIDRVASLIDPLPWDPWPRHSGHWGASFALRREAYRLCGGVPPVPLAEDRALFSALDHADARIRHADDVIVHVLARRVGRAPGGMADVLERRSVGPDPLCDAVLVPVRQALMRARVRRMVRRLSVLDPLPEDSRVAKRIGWEINALAKAAQRLGPGRMWSELCSTVPSLAPRRVALSDLIRETVRAERLVRWLTGAWPDASCDPPFLTLV
jgi:hypothetical protein